MASTTTTTPTTSSGTTLDSLREKLSHLMAQCRDSRRLVLLIVAIGLLLDNMLLTAVVPIIPTFLYELHKSEESAAAVAANLNLLNMTTTTTTTTSSPPAALQHLLSPPLETLLKPSCREAVGRLLEQMITTTTETPLTLPSSSLEEVTAAPQVVAESEQSLRHRLLVSENAEVGVMFASKPVVQALTNLFVGPLTARIGYSWPLFFGLILLFLSTMVFAIGTTYPTLFLARSMQGVGSAFTSVAGMGMLAEKYPDDRERGNCMAIALGGLALGVLIGPPFGGMMYQFVGQSSPFITLALLALLDGCLQLLVLQPEVAKEQVTGPSLLTLIRDPYIAIAAGAITFANAGIAMLEPSLPLWMMDTMGSNNWEQGAAFLPASIAYLVGTNVFGPLGHRIGRWLSSLLGLVMIALALLSIPLATSLAGLIIPNGMIGFAIGMVDSSMMPMLGYLVDIRHSSVYGSVYAIGDVALCVGYIIGPALSGVLVTWFGFGGLCTTTALVCFLFVPAMFALRNPPPRQAASLPGVSCRLNTEGAIKYGAYCNEEEEDDDNGGGGGPPGDLMTNRNGTIPNRNAAAAAFEMLP